MILAGDVLFNLLFNALVAFVLALALCRLLCRAFRLEQSALGLGVLLLPFLKPLLEIARGVPAESFLWLSARGVRQTLGEFRLGFGATPYGPIIDAELWAQHLGGRAPQSGGDLATRILRQKLGASLPASVAFGVLAISFVVFALVVARRFRAFRALRELTARATLLDRRRVGWRSVRILECPDYEGVPFVAGVLTPFIVLPPGLRARLSAAELEAVIRHELAHVVRLDAVLFAALELLVALFWFVPGIRGARNRVAALVEQRADEHALEAGVAPAALARALVVAAEFSREPSALVYPAMTGGATTLAARLRALLGPARRRAPSFRTAPARALLTAIRGAFVVWCAYGILRTSAFGNHAA